ncbi:MAG: hypothetical protein DRP97_04100 [Candidatus Latescibacterota bacterium]|nr:MAG: hypothetical protein DRP97_04100 [Candidatus Latescibacterota bacterium]
MRLGTFVIAVLIGAVFIGVLVAQGTPDYATEIQPILSGNCAGCHVFTGSYEQVMAKQSGADPLIVPGDAAASVLVWRLEGQKADGTAIGRMPAGGSLTPEEIQLFKDWIAAGALAEATTAVESRSWGQIKASF